VLYSEFVGCFSQKRASTLFALAAGAAVALAACAPPVAEAAGSVSTVAPRPMAMGGAFLAVEDEVAAMAWNPAALTVARCSRKFNVRVHANILGAPAIVGETGILDGVHSDPYRGLPWGEKLAVAVGSLVKAVTVNRGGVTFGLLLLEERLDPEVLARSRGIADAGDLLDGHYSSLAFVFRPAATVSLGASATVLADWDESGERLYGAARAYGALLHPNDSVTVGLTYFDFSPRFGDYRRAIEGIAPRTINAGIVYRTGGSLLLTADLRDLAERYSETSLEPRVGVEWSLWGRAALRAGAYREDGADPIVLTLGAGSIPMPACWRGRETPGADTFVLNYGVLLSDGVAPRHLLSVDLRF